MESTVSTLGINVVYTVCETNASKKSIRIDSNTIATMGLPEGRRATKPNAGDYNYHGTHDGGGILVVPKEGGTIAQLIASVQCAKEYNDTYLTEIIAHEKEQKQQQQQQQQTEEESIITHQHQHPITKKYKSSKS